MTTTAAPESKQYADWSEVDDALARLAVIEAKHNRLTAEQTTKISGIKASYKATMEPIASEITAVQAGLQAFMLAHKQELGDAKTKVLDHGEISLRLTPPSLITVKKRTWASVLEAAKLLPKKLRDAFVSVKQEEKVDKDALKAALAAGQLTGLQVKALGVQLHQEEQVYYSLFAEQPRR